jgi:hypothetical protein
MMDLSAAKDAVAPLLTMLSADGYDLRLTAAEDQTLCMEVIATDGACADCLVPKDLFASMATDYLERSGITTALQVRYPVDATSEQH